ncbi:MAG: GNAT family N-acetyltransferase [Ruminiclostridium sp.]|nr:GNAT family N-acetyltransferase [Ruminiclostridium sp.]
MIRLEKITPDNWRLGLRVSEAQKSFVADSAGILARAYAYRESRSNAFIIYNDDTPVGMTLYYDCEDIGAYDLSQFFIDERYQEKGYGFEAMELILDLMKKDGKYDRVELCYIEGNDAARKLYEKLGFALTGDCEDDEIVMAKMLG